MILFRLSFAGMFLAVMLLLTGCDNGGSQPVDPVDSTNVTDTAEVLVPLSFKVTVGDLPFHLDTLYTSMHGVPFRVTNLRWYLSRVTLIDSAGGMMSATLVDSAGTELPYNLALLRADTPRSMTVTMRARPGIYRGLSFAVGVPVTAGVSLDSLNHGNPALRTYPLNYDAEMAWTWNTGYVFFKIEGTAFAGDTARSFFYHLGDDRRYSTFSFTRPITISRSAVPPLAVRMDVARLFVTPTGEGSPNPSSASVTERTAHSGAVIDLIRGNMVGSTVFSIE